MGNFAAGLFGYDHTTGAASVEFWVVVATLLLLAKFAANSIMPRVFSSRRVTAPAVRLLHILNYYVVSYTLGLMSPSSSLDHASTAVNDFFQVWAVLIVTMQDSIRIGRPYKPKEMTLVDLLSSLWSANKLRSQTRLDLLVPLWFIWSVHASRIIWYFVSSSRATEASLDNIKLVSDYMMMTWSQSQHSDDVVASSPGTMTRYSYIVVGEQEQKMDAEPPSFTLKIDLTTPKATELLITVDKVWEQAGDRGDRLLSTAADSDNRFKDVCLSFALYKLQRRRFYNFPIAEAVHPDTRRLVSGAILDAGPDGGYERALRVTEAELSFLHDFFYSSHAAVFAGGVPYVRLLLALLMTAASLYLFYAVRGIPSVGKAVTGRGRPARITHGVLVTHCIIAIIVCRELMEVGFYVLSQWTKVWIVCNYVKLMQRRRRRGRIGTTVRVVLMEKLARIMFLVIRRGRWDQRIRQYNILMLPGTQGPAVPRFSPWRRIRTLVPRKVKLHGEVKKVLFQSLKALITNSEEDSSAKEMNSRLMSYFLNAFADADGSLPTTLIQDPSDKLEGETHKILVWHIATGLCQKKLLEDAGGRGCDLYTLPRAPFAGGDHLAAARPHYIAAVILSNYCAYLVTQALVPDNGLVASKVFEAVRDEVRQAGLSGGNTIAVEPELHEDGDRGGNNTKTIVGMGAELSESLVSAYGRGGALWERLAKFWAGFLLHLSASTRAAKHQIHLQGRGELTTHLWVLLSHAGFLGETRHGEQMLDPVDLNDA